MESLSEFFTDAFHGQPFMAILRGFDRERTLALARTAWDHGIRCVEVPVQSEEACATLEAVAHEGSTRGYPVGAGTVTSPERVERARRAGARFTVAPGFDPEVARASADAGLAHLPGVATATDVQAVERFGLTWMKTFPASVLGPGWLRALHGPFPGARFVATGGMDADNAAEYLAAGAAVVAIGSALQDPAQLNRLDTARRGPEGGA